MLKKIITAVNMAIVTILLVLFYFFIIGLAFVIHRMTKKKERSNNTAWKAFQVSKEFTSPY